MSPFGIIGWIVALYFAYHAGKGYAESRNLYWQNEALELLEIYHESKHHDDYKELLEKFKEYP